MAIAINLLSIDGVDEIEITGTLTITGNYTTGGDTLDWTTISGVGTDNGRIFTPQALPDSVLIAGTTGDSYGYVAGTLLNNGKVKINTASNTELGSGAYNARFTGDTNIYFKAHFPRFE